MYTVVKLAAVSAALAAGLVTTLETRRPSPSPARFLTDRLETEILLHDDVDGEAQVAAPDCAQPSSPGETCTSRLGASGRTIRIIDLRRSPDAQITGARQQSPLAQR